MSETMHEKFVGAILPWVALITAVTLAGIAAYFSILGLTTVFIGAIIPVAIMASGIEVAKLVGASWIYRNWRTVPKFLSIWISAMVVVAMFVTSLGIFGFLSRAYTEHAADNTQNHIEISRLENQINTIEQGRTRAQNTLDQINESLNTLIEHSRISGPDGYRAVRERNLETINDLENIINESESRIASLTQDKLDLERTQAVVEAEIGPIRFVAEMLWPETEDRHATYDKAVRILIMTIIFIFDPFAIALILAANHSLMERGKLKAKMKRGGDDSGGNDDGNDDTPPTPEPPPSNVMKESSDKKEPIQRPLTEGKTRSSMKGLHEPTSQADMRPVKPPKAPMLDKKIVNSDGEIQMVRNKSKMKYHNKHSKID